MHTEREKRIMRTRETERANTRRVLHRGTSISTKRECCANAKEEEREVILFYCAASIMKIPFGIMFGFCAPRRALIIDLYGGGGSGGVESPPIVRK